MNINILTPATYWEQFDASEISITAVKGSKTSARSNQLKHKKSNFRFLWLIHAICWCFGFTQDHLASEPEALGDIAHKGDLPFLFKVLSINKALSIQVIWGAQKGCLLIYFREHTLWWFIHLLRSARPRHFFN